MYPGESPLHGPFVDELTGLANARCLIEDLVEDLEHYGRVGVLLVDLDHFVGFNDRFGRLAGDQALVAVARRLVAIAQPAARPYRLGGDEFVLLHRPTDGRPDATAFALGVLQALREPFAPCELGAREPEVAGSRVTGTIGISGARGSTAKGLLARAGAALAEAKKCRPEVGDRYVVFDDLPPEQITRFLAEWGEWR
jgi:diguanylate cyclase (GGDEF)-like protein